MLTHTFSSLAALPLTISINVLSPNEAIGTCEGCSFSAPQDLVDEHRGRVHWCPGLAESVKGLHLGFVHGESQCMVATVGNHKLFNVP